MRLVYRLLPNLRGNTFQALELVDWDWVRDWGPQQRQRFNGTSVLDAWKPLRVRLIKDPRARLGDMVRLDALSPPLFAFTARAVNALGGLLGRFGELLPLDCSDGEFFAYNVTTRIDALDEDASELFRLPGGAITLLARPVFTVARVTADIFMVPQSLADRFVTDSFARRVRDEGLEGFDLQPCEVI